MITQLIPELENRKVVLASGSPRRLNILQKLGIPIDVVPSTFPEDLDKTSYVGKPELYVLDNAMHKAMDVYKMLNTKSECDNAASELIIAADTVVYYEGRLYEKPANESEAKETLHMFRGRIHQVYTGVVLLRKAENSDVPKKMSFYETSNVKFGLVPENLIQVYIDSGEPFDKAGGYGTQGLGAALIEKIDGDYYNVEGFPFYRFIHELLKFYGK